MHAYAQAISGRGDVLRLNPSCSDDAVESPPTAFFQRRAEMTLPSIDQPNWIIALAIYSAIAIGGATNASAADDKKLTAKPALTVTLTQPQQVMLPLVLSANGTITAWQEAIISSESTGLRLTDIKANVGDVVRTGQVLATFATDAPSADVALARANLQEAQANATDASSNAQRARALQNSGALSTQQVDQLLTLEQTAIARAAAAKAALNVQQLRLQHTRVVAPDNGVITSRTATLGAVVPSGAEMFRMVRQGRLEWRAEVTSTELGKIRTGMSATVIAANGTELKGRVRTVAPTVDVQSRAALVYVDLPAAMTGIAPAKAGMFARGTFDLGQSSALTVPQQALVVRDGFSYIFRVNKDSRISQLKVQVGRRLNARVEVLDALPADIKIVASGAGFLNDGDLVKVVAAN